MVTVVAVNIKRKTEMKVSSQRECYGMKGNLVSCMCSLNCAVFVLAPFFFVLFFFFFFLFFVFWQSGRN